jgi:hypothetical protein
MNEVNKLIYTTIYAVQAASFYFFYRTGIRTMQELLQLPHSLAIVTGNDKTSVIPVNSSHSSIKTNVNHKNSSNSNIIEPDEPVQTMTLLFLGKPVKSVNPGNNTEKKAKPPSNPTSNASKTVTDSMEFVNRVMLCIPLMSLTSFVREWTAVFSIQQHSLIPLAPYLLRGTPVVSSQFVRLVVNLELIGINRF